MNMFKPTTASNVREYMAMLPPERKEIINVLDNVIRETVPTLKKHFANNMIGYGSFDYVNYKKEKIKWPVIALASQKAYVSLYICSIKDGKYLAEVFKDSLGKARVGKSCIRFKKLEDLHLPTLKKVLKAAAKNPGL